VLQCLCLAHLLTQLVPVEARHHDIADDEIRQRRPDNLKGLHSVLGKLHVIPIVQTIQHIRSDVGIIVDDQQCRHVLRGLHGHVAGIDVRAIRDHAVIIRIALVEHGHLDHRAVRHRIPLVIGRQLRLIRLDRVAERIVHFGQRDDELGTDPHLAFNPNRAIVQLDEFLH